MEKAPFPTLSAHSTRSIVTHRPGYTYLISDRDGLDGASFVIDQQSGTLGFLKNAPDFETKSSYKVLLLSKDPGGKAIAKEFSISVADANDAPVITSTPQPASFEDSYFRTHLRPLIQTPVIV